MGHDHAGIGRLVHGGGEVLGNLGRQFGTLQGDGSGLAFGIVGHVQDDAGELVLEGEGHGVGAGQDSGLHAGHEVGGRCPGALVGLNGEVGRTGLVKGIVGGYAGTVGALGIPHQAAGEDAAVEDHLRVVGIHIGVGADHRNANGISGLKGGFAHFGHNRGNAHQTLFALLGSGFGGNALFFAGRQGQQASA